MACSKSKGYQCDFIDSVNDLFYCKQCGLVARRLTIANCCGESYCHACVVDFLQQGKPCPECGEKSFSVNEQLKYQKRIRTLKAYCTMKESGCEWSGTLEQLDTHLDPDQDNCQYMDTKCPLNCHVAIPRNKVEQHVAEECSKRPYVCQHCNFKAMYEEVVNTHLPECKYVPLDCPNRCGVTCDREDMGDHMKICRLQDICCSFRKVGCNETIKREKEDEHSHDHLLQHLTLTADECVQTREKLQEKIKEQDKKIKEQDKKIKEQDKNIKEQDKNIKEQDKNIKEQDKKVQAMEQIQKELSERLILQEERFTKLLKNMFKCSEKFRTFEINNFEKVIPRGKNYWKSPAMYTHVGGYKFFFGVQDAFLALVGADTSGHAVGGPIGAVVGAGVGAAVGGVIGAAAYSAYYSTNRSLKIILFFTKGEYDDELKWPLKARCTVELVNQSGGRNRACIIEGEWNMPDEDAEKNNIGVGKHLIQVSSMKEFIHNSTLYFCIKDIELQNF